MKCDLFIRSYYKDFRWLQYSLRSIEKFCKGFSRVVLVVPESSRKKLDWMGLRGDVTITCPDYRDDYLGQQVTKLYADSFSDADFVCHIDSDCIFRRPTAPEDLFEQGKPRVLMTAYTNLDPHVPWKRVIEHFLLRQVEHEYMRTPPYTFPRWIYGALREHAFRLHQVPLDAYILSQLPRRFSEFNALGAYAFYHHHDSFTWLDVPSRLPLSTPCHVFWSWGGINHRVQQQIESLLA